MSPDMKRLCEAAASQCKTLPIEHGYTASADAEDWEAVVTAILTELDMLSGDTTNYAAGLWSRRNIDAMVEDILAEPATA